MDGPLKELAKLERLTAVGTSAKGKTTSISVTLDSLLLSLNQAKEQLQTDGMSPQALTTLTRNVETKKKEVDDRQKEIYSSVARIGKALDKVRAYLSPPTTTHRWAEILCIIAFLPQSLHFGAFDCSIGANHRSSFPSHRPF